jgi:hypothetical protein
MSREKRKRALGVALGLFGLLATSGTAAAWELALDGRQVQSTELVSFWQQAWFGVREFLGVATSATAPDSGQPQSPPSEPSTPGDADNHAGHSVIIDPNG